MIGITKNPSRRVINVSFLSKRTRLKYFFNALSVTEWRAWKYKSYLKNWLSTTYLEFLLSSSQLLSNWSDKKIGAWKKILTPQNLALITLNIISLDPLAEVTPQRATAGIDSAVLIKDLKWSNCMNYPMKIQLDGKSCCKVWMSLSESYQAGVEKLVWPQLWSLN